MKLVLVRKQEEAKDTKSFYFKTEKKVIWLPGQYFYFTIPILSTSDSRGPTRHFTISLSPTEGALIRLTTRIRNESGFKQTLDSLKMESEIEGEGPNGTFILDENETGNHLLIAGGIGITPFRTFIKYNIDKQSLANPIGKKLDNSKIYLIYSNSTPEEIVFRSELESWSENYENIKVAMTISKPEESKEKWTGLTGRIDENLIKKQIKNWELDIKNLTFWLCGPPSMVEAMERLLGTLKITSDKVRSEKFTGY